MVNLNLADISDIYDTFGPTPRLWLDLIDSEERAQYELDVKRLIDNLTASRLKELIMNTVSLSMDAVSDKKFLIKRMRLSND
jgi:hypothetical protein